MARKPKPISEYMFDQFADLAFEDQAACLEIMRQIHRLAVREAGKREAASAPAAKDPDPYEPDGPVQRVYGATTCRSCGERVAVVYPYSNSDKEIGLVDHTNGSRRCAHAGRPIWSETRGWFESNYPEKSIERRTE